MGKNYGKKLLNYKKYCYMYFLRSKVKILEMYRHCMNKVQKKIKVMRRHIGGEWGIF